MVDRRNQRDDFLRAIFQHAPPGALVELAFGNPPVERVWVTLEGLLAYDFPGDRDVYFGPAGRRARGSKRGDVLGTCALWVDVDREEPPLTTLLPSYVVGSGHGTHLYWLLNGWVDDIERIERANKALALDTQGDDCWNANRLLRVPGTQNFRGDVPSSCSVRRAFPDRVYRLEEFLPLAVLDGKTRHKIRTGDARGYRSRSERDWAVITALIDAGADDQLIARIFETQPVGDKAREDGQHYLDRTITQARAGRAKGGKREIEEREDGYYVRVGRNARRVSTFTMAPRLLLSNIDQGELAEDGILGDVTASGYKWDGVTFTRSAFTSVVRLDKETPYLAWQWLGSDKDVRVLLPHLLQQLQDMGLPSVRATSVLGLHTVEGRPHFVGAKEVLAVGETFIGAAGPLVYLESRREHPQVSLSLGESPSSSSGRRVRDLLPNINRPESFWPTMGWYAATPLKPAFESRRYRFPILNVHGTRGSGKTTTIQRVMMPLLGQSDPRSYDANTTRFVILSILGSSNAIPVAFSEFRFGAASGFLRYVLLAYDTGHDPRGRADQTTVDYPLSAPFSVDGEDLIADPAAKERIIPVVLRPDAVAEGTDAHRAYEQLSAIKLDAFGAPYIRFLLEVLVDGRFEAELGRARRDIFDAFPGRLPDRVRNNFIVTWTGARLFAAYWGIPLPSSSVLGESLRTCYDVERGRALTLGDEMVEDIVNAAASPRGGAFFAWRYDPAERAMWFQLAPAHSWWLYQRRRQNRTSLERDAIRNQLTESPYITGPEMKDGMQMYKVNLRQAQALGLDVPDSVDQLLLHL